MRSQAELYRELPSVDELLHDSAVAALMANEGQVAVTDACRAVLDSVRKQIADGSLDEENLALTLSAIPQAIADELRRALGYSLRPVINATGVILHTNLGRAPLASAALDHLRETAGTYSNLEFDLTSGERGKRDVHVGRLFQKLLTNLGEDCRFSQHSENISTIVVNNNAAAILLALNTLADAGEVIVSRGELVEIGGSFRIPDVMSKSGAILREVGTTNRTRILDYERAISDRTRLLLRVHRSNFEITGFAEQPTIQELVALAQKHKLPLMEDLGSGALFDLRTVGISEPGVLDSLRSGVHVVTYSGDKLLGGPQAGLISGREDLVRKMRSNSLFRALRVDKLTYAALEATLLAYVKRDYKPIPALRMIELRTQAIQARAQDLKSQLSTTQLHAELIPGKSLIGGGAAPSSTLPTILLALTRDGLSANELEARLRASDPPVIGRVEEKRVLLDLRTVFPEQDEVLRQVLVQVAAA
jgi:L-seryl-tRNA(Ser) seleniumtransferase